jgi:hypothetical protein
MKQRLLLLSSLALCGALCAGLSRAGTLQAQEESNKGPAFTIVGARVFDGERWLPAGTQVRVQHGLVLAVGPDVGLPRGGVLIDATGKTLMPETSDTADGKAGATPGDHGAIVTGARADLRLVEGSSQDWNGLGEIVARWRSGVLVGGRRFGATQPL